MDATKLKNIIENKNQRLEEQAVRTAEELIEEILELQNAVTEANEAIEQKRKELKALEVKSLDAEAVLGKD